MTAEEGFKTAMVAQMNATLKGDKKRAEKARSLVQHFKRIMDKKGN